MSGEFWTQLEQLDLSENQLVEIQVPFSRRDWGDWGASELWGEVGEVGEVKWMKD